LQHSAFIWANTFRPGKNWQCAGRGERPGRCTRSNATITVTQPVTGYRQTTQTDAQGSFTLRSAFENGRRWRLQWTAPDGHVWRGPPIRGLSARLAEIRAKTDQLDEEIAPLARAASCVFNPNWGPLMRSGNDKSHLANQMERYADIYTSRVSNLMYVTPFAFLRAPRGSLPHDPTAPGGKMDATTKDNPIT